MDTSVNLLYGNYDKVDKNIGYLGPHGMSLAVCRLLSQVSQGEMDFSEVSSKVKTLIKNIEGHVKVKNFNIGMSLYLLAETIYRNDH